MSAPEITTYVCPRMGTLLAVTVQASRADGRARWARTAFDVASACERVMSRHDENSDLSRLNRTAGDPTGVRSTELARILGLARELASLTEGAFDPTVGPLVDLWRRASRRGRAPSRRSLQSTRELVGWRAIAADGHRVALTRRGMSVDLGGIGKGVALDRIASALPRHRSVSALLNFGESSLLAVGRLPEGGWPVALRHPLGGFAGEFVLRDLACSTSATFGQSAAVGTRTVGHIVHPRDGWPLRAIAQVTVLATSAATAEAASTALLVLGRPGVEQLAERLNVEVCWIDRWSTYTSPGFALRRPA